MTCARLASIVCAAALLAATVAAQGSRKDAAGKDYPLFNRMEGFHISFYRETAFDRYEFLVAPGKKQAVEGHLYRIIYELTKGDGPLPSGVQIVRNHQNAVRKVGGSVVYEDLRAAASVMRVSRDGKDVWIDLSGPFGHRYDLVIVEQEAMQQEIVANAEAWRKDLASEGHAVVYGIHFDTDKAIIKPESGPALQEIAKLLSQDPKLSVYVVGHTDGTGAFEHNLKLSQARAQAVVEALTQQHKISASRLQANGVGPLAPVANNDAEEGRAKNRRVEIVRR